MKNVSTFTYKFLKVTSVLGMTTIVTLPLVVLYFFTKSSYEAYSLHSFAYALIVLYPVGILAWLIIQDLIKIMESIIQENPFNYEIADRLMRISKYSFAIAIIFILAYMFSPLFALIIIVLFGIIGLLTRVFSKLFKIATEVKKENDFTI